MSLSDHSSRLFAGYLLQKPLLDKCSFFERSCHDLMKNARRERREHGSIASLGRQIGK